MLDCPWPLSLFSRTVRASELGFRFKIENTKLSFLLAIALFMGTVPSRQFRAVDGHLVGSPWIVLRIFLCTISSSVFVSIQSSEPNRRMGKHSVLYSFRMV